MEIVNRKARYDYFVEDEIEAGIVLTGTEIKSIRAGKANIGDSYAIIRKNEILTLLVDYLFKDLDISIDDKKLILKR